MRAQDSHPWLINGLYCADAFQRPHRTGTVRQRAADATHNPSVEALLQRAQRDVALAKQGRLPNSIPADEVTVHGTRRRAITAAGAVLALGTMVGLALAIRGVRRQFFFMPGKLS
jgi:hypothetical protein